MKTEEKILALQKTELFREAGEKALQSLAERAVETKLERGEILFMAGEEARGLYVIAKGSVRAFRTSVDGREQTIHIERSGSTIAEVPVFDNGIYPSNVAAEESSVLLFIDKRDVRQICLEYPQIALSAAKLLAGRLRRCAELVEFLSLREVGQRLAHLLLEEAKLKSAGENKIVRFTLKVTNQQIAARVGTVREVISRAFTRLQNDGLISIEGRDVTIHDKDALRIYAGNE